MTRKRPSQPLTSCPDGCSGEHFVFRGVDTSPDFWTAIEDARRAYTSVNRPPGNVTPDKAKDHQLPTDGLSAPHIPADGTTGVEYKYSR